MVVYYQYQRKKGFHALLVDLALYLKNAYNAKLIELESDKTEVSIGDSNLFVQDCEILIYQEADDVIKAISFADNDTKLGDLFYSRNREDDVLVKSHNSNTSIRYLKNKYKFNYRSTIYVPENPRVNLDHYYIRRILTRDYIDKMVFWGNVHPMDRNTIDLLKESPYFEGGQSKMDSFDYFYDIINYKVGLAIPGIAEFCHRDVEYLALGIPMMKFEYLNEINPPLIPNYHYISIDRIDDNISDERIGGEVYRDLYIKRFLEVKDDYEFLNFISQNAREYYLRNIHPLNAVNTLLNTLEL